MVAFQTCSTIAVLHTFPIILKLPNRNKISQDYSSHIPFDLFMFFVSQMFFVTITDMRLVVIIEF